MGILSRLRARRPGTEPPDALHVGDPRFDHWDVVADFEDLKSARAWLQHASEAGLEAALTADWPLDRFGRGDIALRVPPGREGDAEELLGELEG